MYCLIYYESKLFIVYMNIVCAFIIIDVIWVRCKETEKHYCKINEYAFITIYIQCTYLFGTFLLCLVIYPTPYYLLCTGK